MRTIPAVENGESCLNPVFWPFTNLDQYSFQIRLCQMDISAFSGQNKVTKMCLRYLLTSYYKWSSQFQILVDRSGKIKQYTQFPSLNHVCQYEYGQYADYVSNIYG